ncbi:MAG TPA: hypothetical protein VFX89_11350 [Gammaproteobacteria bacterium]|nr:hypothetical protein [Gammaproteobacteria bacterium]
MLALLKRWLGWDTDSGPFDFSDLDPSSTDRPVAAAPSTVPTAKPAQKQPPRAADPRRAPGPGAVRPPSPAKPQANGAKQSTPNAKAPPAPKPPAPAAKGAAPNPKAAAPNAKPAAPGGKTPKKDPIDALHNPSLTLDRPSEDGFDPYNTGAFNRSTSWERISRHKR